MTPSDIELNGYILLISFRVLIALLSLLIRLRIA